MKIIEQNEKKIKRKRIHDKILKIHRKKCFNNWLVKSLNYCFFYCNFIYCKKEREIGVTPRIYPNENEPPNTSIMMLIE